MDIVTAREHNNIETIEGIALGEENAIQDDVDIWKYDSNTLQKNHCSSYMGLAV